MPLHTLERLEELAKKGIPVVFENELPDEVPGLHQLKERRQKLSELKARMKKSDHSRISSEIKEELINRDCG